MNLNRIVMALIVVSMPAYGVKIGNDKVLTYWILGYFKETILKINKNILRIQGKFDSKKDVSLFEYKLQNGKTVYSFYNRRHLTPFKNADVVAYLEQDGQFVRVAEDCKGTSTEEILSEAPIFGPQSRISFHPEQNLEFHCYARSLEVRSHIGEYKKKIIQQHTEEHPFLMHHDQIGNDVKILLPYYDEGLMGDDAQSLTVLMHDNIIRKFVLDSDYQWTKK